MATNSRAATHSRRRLPDLAEFFKGCQQMQVERGAYVCMPSDPADRMFFVLSGCIRIKAYSLAGGERILTYAFPGSTFCEPGVLVGKHSGIAADALETSTVGWMRRAEVHDRINVEPDFAKAMLQLLATKLRWRSAQVVNSSFSNAARQVASALAHLATELGAGKVGEVDIPITHSELASYVGVSRVSVTNSLAQLEADGLVQRQAGAVSVRDLAALKVWLSISPEG